MMRVLAAVAMPIPLTPLVRNLLRGISYALRVNFV
jgi:hypothetical protein